MEFIPGATGRAPVVRFDPRPPQAAFAMFALVTWPTDPVRQQQWFAVQNAALIEKLRDPSEHLRAADIQRYKAEAESHGVDPEVIATHGRAMLSDLAMDVLQAAGGYSTVIHAPAYDALVQDVLKASQGGARRAGELLFVVACMQAHHPELPPSLNRAMAVVEVWHSRPGRTKPTGINERALKDTWEAYRTLAPLWAGLILHEHVTANMEGVPVAAAFLDPQHRYLVLAAALWFRTFATSFTPSRAREPLISATDVLDFDVGVEPADPMLPPLPPEMLEVAQNYRAKNTKHGY